MTGTDDDSHAQTDDSTATSDDSGPILDVDVDRRTALKGSVAGLAALGLGGLSSGTVAAGHNANKVAAAGSGGIALRVDSEPNKVISKIGTLLGPLEVKTARDPKQALSVQPTMESSLFTRTVVEKSPDDEDESDTSKAEAGVLGWIEVNGDATDGTDKIVTVNGNLVEAPATAEDLIPDHGNDSFVDDGQSEETLVKEKYRDAVVAFNTRAYQMDWTWEPQDDDDEEVDEEEMAAHMRTRSANGFGWIAPLRGQNSIALRGVTYVYESDTGDDTNADAAAFVGNRTMMIDPIKLHHEVQ